MSEADIQYQAEAFEAWWSRRPGDSWKRAAFGEWAASKAFGPEDMEAIWAATEPEQWSEPPLGMEGWKAVV